MSPELQLLTEVWDKFKGYVPAKERLELATDLLMTFEEHIEFDEVRVYQNEFDGDLKAALLNYLDDDLEDDDADEGWD